MNEKAEALKGKLVVSCQALEDEPLHSFLIMGKMASQLITKNFVDAL